MNNYYTYAYLREDGTPYYIGKGKGDRAYAKHRRKKNLSVPLKERILILKQNLKEEEAFRHEIYMIAVFGRKDLGTGILRNMSDGGKGGKGVPAWNKGGTIPKHQKEINRQMMNKRYENGLDVSGANNPRAKTWRIVYNDGRELIIKSIHDWMNKNGYSKSAIRNVYTGKWLKTKDIIFIETVENTPLKSVQEILNDYHKKISNPNWGKMSNEAKQKLSKERIGINNQSSKWWRITFSDGRVIERCGLVNWCKENEYDLRSIQRVKNKQRKKHKDIVAVEELSQAPSKGALDAL